MDLTIPISEAIACRAWIFSTGRNCRRTRRPKPFRRLSTGPRHGGDRIDRRFGDDGRLRVARRRKSAPKDPSIPKRAATRLLAARRKKVRRWRRDCAGTGAMTASPPGRKQRRGIGGSVARNAYERQPEGSMEPGRRPNRRPGNSGRREVARVTGSSACGCSSVNCRDSCLPTVREPVREGTARDGRVEMRRYREEVP